jgi:hypothetical protein
VPRLRSSPLALALRAVALIAIAVPVPSAMAQSDLLRPELSGDPRNPPTFQRRKAGAGTASALERTRSAFEPLSGVGTTGFDSTNAKKRKGKDKEKEKLKPGQKAKAAPYPDPFGVPQSNPLAPPKAPSIRPVIGVERKGAAAYAVAPTPLQQGDPTPRRRIIPDETPFDPIGIQVGAFNFKPALELTGGYDTNAPRTNVPAPSWFSIVAPELKFASNWARHSFTGDLRGTYTSYRELPSQNRPSFDGKLNGRVDVTRDTRIDLETRLLVGTDAPGSPNIQAGLAKLPIFTTWGGTVGLGQRFNRLDFAVKGGVERTVYQDSVFTDGSVASNEDRNYWRYFTVLRTTYELTPAVKPFVEVGADRRVHDLEIDVFGFQRNSDGFYGKGGSTFELSRIVTGEASVGWIRRRYQDPTLPDLAGVSIDGSLAWVISALTTAKLSALTRADESTVPGVSGVLTREVTLEVNHAFRRWLIATARLTRGHDDYVGSDRRDDRTSPGVALTYKLTRELHLKGEYRRDMLRSSVPGAAYNADVFMLGLRLQR